ncbi:HD-GYP domain-containing protein [Candidatus Nitronereus thalassa]|uniref:DUF3391 domain-containing protein n=1 Tax=Candidatus Nitronereus thalassa TaxID=3020898 RepID=A0ABU3K6B4_9BACT|nr:HD domain-containing phosphohydrolase [Candidatus Nitronereus thalassa]MDT7041887.1 DUF3391 domain-containing protein [Candidatus Nitronereus thalassa]
MKKQISLDQLKPGMFLMGMDQSWWNTPFILHHRIIKNIGEVERLRQSGVRTVVIETSKGLDVEESSAPDTPDANEPQGIESSVVDETVLPELGSDIPNKVSDVRMAESCDDHNPQHPKDSLAPSFRMDSGSGSRPSDSPQLTPEEGAQRVRDEAVRAVQKVFEGVHSGEPIDQPALENMAHDIVQNVVDDPKAFSQIILIQNLSSVDKYLYHHVVDVCALSVVLGIEMGWEEKELKTLAMGALLHDLGYVRLPNNLVRKRKTAGEAERQLLSKHAELGYAMVQSSTELSPGIKQIILEHHERSDGTGEPHGLQGSVLSLLSQVVGLVDEFDKLTSNWGAGPSRPTALVLRELYHEAQQGRFSLRPIERLIQCLGVYPLGSLVELSTGEQGVVVMTNPTSLLKPKIKLIVGPDHLPYPVPIVIDLNDSAPGDPARSIRSLLDAHQEQIQVEKYMTVGASA